MGEDSDSETRRDAQGPGLAAALGSASRAQADAYLAEQTELTRLQIEREKREDRRRDWLLAISHASAILKLAFEFVVALIVLVIGVAVGAALWAAAHDNGLVIEAFSVPPDLASRGLTGEVVAGKVLDRLATLQAQTVSNRAASSYVNNWGSDIKVQIPETGVSIGELYRYLAQWLGHETHITGEIYRDAKGLAVTAHVGGQPATTLHGNDADLDTLIQQSAEAVYRKTQPYRYAVYLDNHGRSAEATALYKALIAGDSIEDRAWAYIGLGSQRSGANDFDGADAALHKAMALRPGIPLIYANLANNEATLQHDEQSLAYTAKAVAAAASTSHDASMGGRDVALMLLQTKVGLAQGHGDIAAAVALNQRIIDMPDDNGSRAAAEQGAIALCAALHDRACYDAALEMQSPSLQRFPELNRAANIQQADFFFGAWADIVTKSRLIRPALVKIPVGHLFLVRGEYPVLAVAYAELGDFETADGLLAQMPPDCVVCLRVHGRVAGLERRWGAADYWFARAARAAPSTPNPFLDWGEVLLWRGDLDAAIAKLGVAHAKGPRFADPLELWGEALIAKNRSDLALAKFAEAARYAPNWGRLHLKWGEALLWSGDAGGARKQFALAASLFLTPAERAQLDSMQHGHR
jgi:tetratricopeptide (TPR) repeat protein